MDANIILDDMTDHNVPESAWVNTPEIKTYIRGKSDVGCDMRIDFYDSDPVNIKEIIDELNDMAKDETDYPSLGSCVAILVSRLSKKAGKKMYFNGTEVI